MTFQPSGERWIGAVFPLSVLVPAKEPVEKKGWVGVLTILRDVHNGEIGKLYEGIGFNGKHLNYVVRAAMVEACKGKMSVFRGCRLFPRGMTPAKIKLFAPVRLE